MDRNRVGHNAKGRQSTGGRRKRGKQRAKTIPSTEPAQDPNALIVTPKTEAEKEADRRERLKQEVWFNLQKWISPDGYPLRQLIAQSESKMNSKKKKRLEKYIVRVLSRMACKKIADTFMFFRIRN